MNRACFPKEKHQNSQKWAKFMNFSFCPSLWFGLPGRLLKEDPAFEIPTSEKFWAGSWSVLAFFGGRIDCQNLAVNARNCAQTTKIKSDILEAPLPRSS